MEANTSKEQNKMKTLFKILIFALIVIAILFVVFFIVVPEVKSIQKVKITNIKSQYSINEEVIISGFAKENTKIIIYYGKRMGLLVSDSKGKWVANLGRLPVGKYPFQVLSDDSEENRSTDTAQIVVKNLKANNWLGSLSDSLIASLSGQLQKVPEKIISIPQQSPEVFKGKWKLSN